jgi:predicted secreted hydrolase
MKRLLWIGLVLGLVALSVVWWQRGQGSATAVSAELVPLLSDTNTEGFARATEPGAVRFPDDLGAHDDYQTEWWYYTGNLADANGREFGYQFTIFRRALAASTAADAADSNWRTNQVYFAHFAISDVANEEFYAQERFSRGSAGLAGAQAAPYRVWIEDWSAQEVADGVVRLTAVGDEVALELDLRQTLPPILHGDAGLSAKGPEPGNASYYYSLVQQQAEGTVRIGEEQFAVSGVSWKDHEYSTSALSAGAVGWDWFSLQLDNGAALMFFQIRQEDGTIEPYSSGTYIAPDGTATPLAVDDWQLTVTDSWRSPESGADYPAGWQISVPGVGLELAVRPLMPNQELNLSTTYWEGAVAVEGTQNGQPVSGRGYVELTGYAESMKGRI